MKWISRAQIQKMSYQELGKAVASGQISEKRLRSAYSSLRSVAMKRVSTLEKRGGEFGVEKAPDFMKIKNLPTTSSLLKELADVNRFLNRKTTTVTGLKQQRETVIQQAQKAGVEVDYSNYTDWIRFLNWFKDSQYSMLYDSDSEAVAEVFNSSQSASKEDWERLMLEFNANYGKNSGSKKY